MLELEGKNGVAKVFTDNIEEQAIKQVVDMMNSSVTKDKQVRIMPDVHAGKGSTVGTTIMGELSNISPNIVGVDVGCGIMMWKIDKCVENIDLKILDEVAREVIPTGFSVHDEELNDFNRLDDLTYSLSNVNKSFESHVLKSIGTLGGGNHYMELAVDENDGVWLSVHSGSRGLGVSVARHHQKIAEDNANTFDIEMRELIDKLKKENRHRDIEHEVLKFKEHSPFNEKGLATLNGKELSDYLNDMSIAQEYAVNNRECMLRRLVNRMGWSVIDKFDSMHNYADIDSGIIRKGATSAKLGERLVTPLNMRDGSLICIGKGNEDWNYSAPHGAGRAMSRTEAKKMVDFKLYKKQMENVYSSSVVESTLDEAPDAYKPSDEIIKNIGDTVDIIHHLKPVWNMKSK